MGLFSFPTSVSEGVLPILIINTALTFAVVKDVLRSVLQIVGFSSNTEPDLSDPLWSLSSESTTASGSSGSFSAEEIRQSLYITQFKSSLCEGSSSINNTHFDCAVCLSKFEDGDEMRELPCCHFFHRFCLDKWLDHHQTTCPLCRSSLVPEEVVENMRLRDQDFSDELMLWCSSFHGVGFHGMGTER